MRSFRRKLAGLRPGGFTLVELAVVSAILAGLAVAVVTYVGSTSQTVNTEMTATVSEVRTGVDTSGLGSYGGGSGASVLLSYGGSQLTFSRASTSQTFSPTVENLVSPTFSVSGTLPDGVSFDAATGVFTGPSAWNFEAVQISASYAHTCAVTTAGGAKCWGANDFGQLGDGTTTQRETPVDVSGLTSGVASISAGGYHTCALTTAGGVKCWGGDGYGALGDGTTTQRETPVDVSGLTAGVASISTGSYHTCALTTDGAAKCWGRNGNGQLGDGTTTDRTTSVDVSGLTSGVVSIAAGGRHTCAVTTAGGAKCWGWNSSGQLGDGTTTQSTTPVDVSGLTAGVASISTGRSHTCAVTTAGGAKCWGSNSSGQLGDGTTTQRTTPVDVSGLASGVASVSVSTDLFGSTLHTCAVTTAGGAKCWGWNSSGQLGDGTTTDRTTPVDVSGLASGVASVSTGGTHTCALTTAGGAKCWGANNSGQLGDGTQTQRETQVDVSGITGNPGWPAAVTVTAADGTLTAESTVTLQKQ
jgi:prepilin-type N-terminal cleavage/methylation domain-containing protein